MLDWLELVRGEIVGEELCVCGDVIGMNRVGVVGCDGVDVWDEWGIGVCGLGCRRVVDLGEFEVG